MSAFFDSRSEVNAINPAFLKKLGLVVLFINIGVQKINSTIFETYEMVVATFLAIDQVKKVKFFEKTFLIANISSNVVLGYFFLFLVMQISVFQEENLDRNFIPLRKLFPLPNKWS